MSDPSIVASVATLAVADPASCDRAALAELVALSQRVRGWLDAFDATVAIHAGHLADTGACEPAAALLTGGGRRSTRDARAAADRGAVCDLMPGVHDALAAGTVAAGHVDAIGRIAGQLDDDGRAALVELAPAVVASAATSAVEAFERELRDLARVLAGDDGVGQHERIRRQRSLRRWIDRTTGLMHTHVALDPEADARFSAALDAAVATEQTKSDHDQSRTFEQLRADAFVALATGARGSGRRPAELTVLVDLDTLRDGLHAHSVCETGDGQPLPPATIRRLACHADIIPIVLDGDGVTLDVGRTRRVATVDQRRALRAMYRTCGHPGCTVRFDDCDIHHVIEWQHHRGPTNLDNLLPLCSRHHHLVHDGHWQLTLHPDRTITLHRPDGTTHFQGSTIDVAPADARAQPPDPDTVPDEPDDALTAALARVLQSLVPPTRAA